MFGEAQLRWLERILDHPETAVVVLASGNEWLATGGMQDPDSNESLAQYPEERRRIVDAIGRSSAAVLLLSGDRHFAEILDP